MNSVASNVSDMPKPIYVLKNNIRNFNSRVSLLDVLQDIKHYDTTSMNAVFKGDISLRSTMVLEYGAIQNKIDNSHILRKHLNHNTFINVFTQEKDQDDVSLKTAECMEWLMMNYCRSQKVDIEVIMEPYRDDVVQVYQDRMMNKILNEKPNFVQFNDKCEMVNPYDTSSSIGCFFGSMHDAILRDDCESGLKKLDYTKKNQ